MKNTNLPNIESIWRVFSKTEHIDLMSTIANARCYDLTPEHIRKKLNITMYELNQRTGALMNEGLIEMINQQYMLTRLGNTVHGLLLMVEEAIKISSELNTCDGVEGTTNVKMDEFLERTLLNKELRQLVKQKIPQKSK